MQFLAIDIFKQLRHMCPFLFTPQYQAGPLRGLRTLPLWHGASIIRYMRYFGAGSEKEQNDERDRQDQ